MKGIGKEQAFTVTKRRNPARFQKNHEMQLPGQIMKKKTPGEKQRFHRLEEYGGASQRETRAGGNEGHNSYRVHDPDAVNSRNDDSVTLNDEEFDHQSIDDSLEDQNIGGNIVKMGDLNKDDKLIVKRLAENERYNLVERPRFLFSFDLNEQEKMFFAFLLTQNFSSELFHNIAKALFDVVIVEFLCWEFLKGSE